MSDQNQQALTRRKVRRTVPSGGAAIAAAGGRFCAWRGSTELRGGLECLEGAGVELGEFLEHHLEELGAEGVAGGGEEDAEGVEFFGGEGLVPLAEGLFSAVHGLEEGEHAVDVCKGDGLALECGLDEVAATEGGGHGGRFFLAGGAILNG
jgi:hypothetical protein